MMNWKDLVNSNFSRKAEIVIVTIAALVYVGTLQAAEGATLHVELVKWAIYGIIWIGTLGIFAQAVIDRKNGKPKTNDYELDEYGLPKIRREDMPAMPPVKESVEPETKPGDSD